MSGLLFSPYGVLIVGVEPYPSGGLKVYLGHRGAGRYVRVEDEESVRRVRLAWASRGHVVADLRELPRPIYTDARLAEVPA